MRNSEAALRIQACFRGYRTRNIIRQMNFAATKIQKIYKGYSVRTRMRPKRSIQQHKKAIDNQLKDTEKRIAFLESQMREVSQANSTRMQQFETVRRERAARSIQRHFRGYVARKGYSRTASPVKSVFDDDENDSKIQPIKSMQLWDPQEEEIELENTVKSIVDRLHKDQFVHDSLLGLYGGVSREMSVINQEISKDRKLTANSIVSKLQVLQSLLDDYYGKVDDDQIDTNNLINECASLRNEIENIMDILTKENCTKTAEDALLEFKMPPKLAQSVHQENKRKSKLMQLNWWELVELYCTNDSEVDTILELLNEDESSSNQVY